MQISIIIPTINEAENIASLLEHLQTQSQPENIAEIIVVDGGSQDQTITIAQAHKARVISSAKGRAQQMNAGAQVATGQILYFLHADSLPPPNFDHDILTAHLEGYEAGSFRHQFDHNHPVLRLTSWMVNHTARVQLGDQSLFVTKSTFTTINGFDESLLIMEDSDLTYRLRQQYPTTQLNSPVVTSARKFRENGELRLFLIFFLIYLLYEFGASQKHLVTLYKRLIRQDKI